MKAEQSSSDHREGAGRGAPPLSIMFIAAVVPAVAWVVLSAALVARVPKLPYLHSLPLPRGVAAHAGSNWMVLRSSEWWGESASITFGAATHVIIRAADCPEMPFPNLPDRAGVLALREQRGPDVEVEQRAAGWPMRIWVRRAVRTSPGEDWFVSSSVIWSRAILSLPLAAMFGAALGWFGWTLTAWSKGVVRRARGVCVSCAYDHPEIQDLTQCPECGVPRARRALGV